MAIYVREAPPARPAMRRPPRPSTIAVWIDGHWTWTGTQFVWTRGYWDRNPPRGKRWLPGRWRQSDRGWYWVPGEWR
ncbi:hypothetical protein [Stakelama marina]|uniref:YXWGXW repeat-containing protein n=1 Tax=Stakelama marina TaxID=2826939 RepID=A0A8T4IB49_9SPHN|nr:hypothetical protein [Stakelama marina]MBR0551044.1 YXWGXW repeat-containing protein [Stakelama marina]